MGETKVTFFKTNILGFAASAALALALPVNTAEAGFFDFLFQPLLPPAVQPAPLPGDPVFRLRHKAKPVNLHQVKPAADKMRLAKGAFGPPLPAPGLMDDDSLREGDAVMTQSGIRVFTGASGRRHRAEDFASLSDLRSLPKQARSALLAIDAHRSEVGSRLVEVTLVTGRSAAEPQIAAGALITDPKGNTIRYVGP